MGAIFGTKAEAAGSGTTQGQLHAQLTTFLRPQLSMLRQF